MGAGQVLVEDVEGLRILTLARPGRFNGMDTPMLESLVEEVRKAAWERSVRAVLLTGDGEVFSAGGDPAEMAGSDPAGIADRWTNISADVAGRIFRMEKPVISAVDGLAIGAGFALAIACDVVLASERARFGPVFVRRAIIPDHAALWFLPRIVGMLKAKELVLSGRIVEAVEAERIGLCTLMLPVEGFAMRAREYALELASGPTRALGAAKLIMNTGMEGDLETVQAFERMVLPSLFGTADFGEAFAAFADKRDPVFRGE